MKNLELETIGVQEMNIAEMNEHVGGIAPIILFFLGVAIASGCIAAESVFVDHVVKADWRTVIDNEKCRTSPAST